MRNRKTIWKKFALLNPRNLEREVHIYGYHFSWKAHSLWILGALLGSGLLGMIFRLETGAKR